LGNSTAETHNIAVYIDLENVAIGCRDARYKVFDSSLVFKRMIDKGNVVTRRAYADWTKYPEYRRPLHENGVELIEMPGSKLTGKNSADIKMVVDALELSYTKPHIDTFTVVSGDSDFSHWSRSCARTTGTRSAAGSRTRPRRCSSSTATSSSYDDLVRRTVERKPVSPKAKELPKKQQEAFDMLLDAVEALQRENKELHGSLVKETMKRKNPGFNEEYHGYRSFSRLLEDAQKNKVIAIHKDARSGTYVIDEVLD
jgi:uncharacterized LabA/DUF88 family protein